MKSKKFIIFILLAAITTIFSAVQVSAVSTIAAVDSGGVTQSNFTEGDSIYILGQCSDAEDNEIDVYVVGNNAPWVNGMLLTDVRGTPQPETAQDPQGNFGLTQVWASSIVGEYDLVIDVQRNGVYDAAVDCVDDANTIGFTVDPAPVVGSGTVAKGSNDPGDHGWVIGEGDPDNVMLQLALSADSAEDVSVNSVSLSAGGTGDDKNAITTVKIYEDQFDDGIYNSDPTLWGQGTFDADSGSTTINISQTIPAGNTRTIIVVYEMGSDEDFSDGDTFQVSVDSIGATGITSSQAVTFSGLPKTSGVKTVTLPEPEAECSGNINLNFDVSSYEPGETINATISGFSDCGGETIKVYENGCFQGLACECIASFDSDTSCGCNFSAPEIEGVYIFTSCLDINADSDYEDEGEEDNEIVTVAAEEEPSTESPFEDTQNHWAESYINDLYDAGVVQGRSETAFEPNELITRAEVTKIAMLAFEHTVPASITEDPFPDVSSDAWFGTYVSGAQDGGIIEGYPDGMFRPGQNINRVEVLKILIEAASKNPTGAPPATFPDTESDAWYSAYINYGIANGIVSGYSGGELDGLFAPGNFATRAEVAKMTAVLMLSQ